MSLLLVLQQKIDQKIDQKVSFFAKMALSSLYKKCWSSKNYQACILNFTLPHFRRDQREANGFLTN